MHKRQSNAFCIKKIIYFSLTVKAATLIFISGRGSALSSAKEGKSWFFISSETIVYSLRYSLVLFQVTQLSTS